MNGKLYIHASRLDALAKDTRDHKQIDLFIVPFIYIDASKFQRGCWDSKANDKENVLNAICNRMG